MFCWCCHSCCCADLAGRLVKADPKRVAALATNVSLIAARLLRLRDIFPKVGVTIVQGCVHVQGLGWHQPFVQAVVLAAQLLSTCRWVAIAPVSCNRLPCSHVRLSNFLFTSHCS